MLHTSTPHASLMLIQGSQRAQSSQQKRGKREPTLLTFNWNCEISGSSSQTHVSVLHKHTDNRVRGHATKADEPRELEGDTISFS